MNVRSNYLVVRCAAFGVRTGYRATIERVGTGTGTGAGAADAIYVINYFLRERLRAKLKPDIKQPRAADTPQRRAGRARARPRAPPARKRNFPPLPVHSLLTQILLYCFKKK
ncbi:hypothetical protein EVAR_60972_1 [Eumeta japonica]|uniref:Uncharacterized protein n=1 Tax=Eumeta variegata TaxID=151549 RepID=A0A4C1XXL2_EUMVA|nr:hypothetical protein EVAR_60972_1 [Eumeta japonica]